MDGEDARREAIAKFRSQSAAVISGYATGRTPWGDGFLRAVEPFRQHLAVHVGDDESHRLAQEEELSAVVALDRAAQRIGKQQR